MRKLKKSPKKKLNNETTSYNIHEIFTRIPHSGPKRLSTTREFGRYCVQPGGVLCNVGVGTAVAAAASGTPAIHGVADSEAQASLAGHFRVAATRAAGFSVVLVLQ